MDRLPRVQEGLVIPNEPPRQPSAWKRVDFKPLADCISLQDTLGRSIAANDGPLHRGRPTGVGPITS